MNPLFSDEPDQAENDSGYLLDRGAKHRIGPQDSASPAVEMIRRKIDALYAHEPSAKEEAAEIRARAPRSKHQEFMYKLTTSGKAMPEIQTEWHNYYSALPDNEKREVWQEFYTTNTTERPQAQSAPLHHVETPIADTPLSQQDIAAPAGTQHGLAAPSAAKKSNSRTVAAIKKQVLKRVRTNTKAQIKARQHLQSLAFGIGIGALVLLISLFGLFNELIIAPFIKPSTRVAAAPIILSSDAPAPSELPEVIIPKINAELPIVYGAQSLDEKEVQKDLENGVFHYPTTALPGQNGNAAYFGHSSNNIFSKGKYKFAFVLLRQLEPGDIFYLTYDKKVYTYKVFSKKVVSPEDTWVLGPVEGKTATAALITCDPPGSTRHRLVVWGEQISPDPATNGAAATPSPALQSQALPGKGPSAWSRFVNWINPF
jgi:LPXTG-site transpeptidase (sortase) family protein